MNSIELLIGELIHKGLMALRYDKDNTFNELIVQAKEMHKKEIIDAYVKGYVEDIPNPIKSEYYIANGEQYYQDTFGNKGSNEIEQEPLYTEKEAKKIIDEIIQSIKKPKNN
jgi:hypothetical protein